MRAHPTSEKSQWLNRQEVGNRHCDSAHFVLHSRFILIFSLFILSSGLMSALAQPAPADRFKAFITSPPVIKRYVLEAGNGKESVKPTNYYLLRWQSNAFLVSSSTNSFDLDKQTASILTSAFGRFDKYWWSVFGTRADLTEWHDTGNPQESTNDVYFGNRLRLFDLDIALNFGVPYVEVGSINWNNDSFDYTNAIYGHILNGVLTRDAIGRVERIVVKGFLKSYVLLKTAKTAKWEISYHYSSTNLNDFLPKNFNLFSIGEDGSRRLAHAYRILELQTNETLLTENEFQPDPYLKGGFRVVVSGKNLFARDAAGNFSKVTDPLPSPTWLDTRLDPIKARLFKFGGWRVLIGLGLVLAAGYLLLSFYAKDAR